MATKDPDAVDEPAKYRPEPVSNQYTAQDVEPEDEPEGDQ